MRIISAGKAKRTERRSAPKDETTGDEDGERRVRFLEDQGTQESLHQVSEAVRHHAARTVAYFKAMAEDTALTYQSLINLYLRDCAVSGRKL